MQQISEQFRVVEMDFRSREKLNKELEEELQNDILQILEIGHGSEGLYTEFDAEGDSDFLKLNFGGRNVDIKRSVLTKPHFGWNLFSGLFQKRWDRFHVRDKKGRIYVDMKEEWMRPSIDYMKYSDSSETCLSASNRSLVDIMRFFQIFDVDPPTDKIVLNGLIESSRIRGVHIATDDFRNEIADACFTVNDSALRYDLKLLYTLTSAEPVVRPIPENLDLRFKSFLILLEMKDGYSHAYTVLTNQQMTSQHHVEGQSSSGNICSVGDLFPLQCFRLFDGNGIVDIHLQTHQFL
jgi:hypothetical protein